MADTKISLLPSAGALAGTEPLAIVQGGVTKQTTVQDVADLAAGGNASITNITEAALAALETAGSLSLTTLYIVTDATPYKLMCKAEIDSQLAKTATIIDDVYSGTVNYDVQTGTVRGGRISDGFNQFIGVLPSAWTLGSGCRRNVFYAETTGTFGDNCSGNTVYQGNDITLGDDCVNNIFNAGSSAMVFGVQLQNTTVESATIAGTFTASPDYDFLYSTSEFCTIFSDGTDNYHMFADPTNDRFQLTLMASPFTVSYIGGGGGGGDVYLANDQTFTGENTFAIASGTKEPIIITKGGNGAGLKVTKSSGTGDAIEVAQGSVSIADETASTIASFDVDKKLKSLATATYPSLTELSYVKGVTSAIQTQLNALNANTPIVSTGNGTAVTGTTSNSYTKGLLIPANSRGANQAPQIDVKVSKTGTSGTLTIRIYWNTTDDLAGSPILLGLSTALAASIRATSFMRIASIEVADGTGNGTLVSPVTVAGQQDYAAYTAVQTSAAIDWTAAGYIVCAVQNGSTIDSSVCNMIKLH